MKKIYLIITAILGMSMMSCLKEEKPLFDKSPAERMDAYLSEFGELLESSKDGWLLEYYAEEEQSYGGYAYILDFKDGEVTAHFQLAEQLETTRTSYYKLVPDDGPVLTFDTYNEYLHFFSTPDIYDYEALHGDYEFRLLGKNDSGTEIMLQGKRTGNYMKLRRFDGDPVEYLEKSLQVEEGMSAPVYSIEIKGMKGECALAGNYFQYRYTPEGSEQSVKGGTAFCYTDTGIRLYQPVEVEGIELYEFTFDSADEALNSNDGPVKIKNVYLPLSELVTFGDWFISRDNLGAYPYAQMMEAHENLIEDFGGVLAINLGDYFGQGWGLNVLVEQEYLGIFGLEITPVSDNRIQVAYKPSENSPNAEAFLEYGDAAPLLLPFGTEAEPKSFILSADNEKNPQSMLLTDESDPDNVIGITRTLVLF